ncbi:DUF5701 family protein [Nocardiopsis potens]|uniref:DUF5701 family protein n=1 Tax=Nocardiopsis potens TaxID=1246458 RepID=UPI000349D1AF|nr:DUF5701 family protein [Nocardiopsis potens]
MQRSRAYEEFDRQVRVLAEKDYPGLSGLGAEGFAALVKPLRDAAVEAAGADGGPWPGEDGGSPGRIPFVLVVTRDVVPIEESMVRTALPRGRKPGFVDRSYEEGALARFTATEETALPDPRAYLLTGVDRGEEFCGAVPADAMAAIRARGRTPLTIEEGIALVTLFPAALEKNKCFSLGGSRCGDRRVPALWISDRAPKLGWCWEGNPHTWLGMASAAARTAGRAD